MKAIVLAAGVFFALPAYAEQATWQTIITKALPLQKIGDGIKDEYYCGDYFARLTKGEGVAYEVYYFSERLEEDNISLALSGTLIVEKTPIVIDESRKAPAIMFTGNVPTVHISSHDRKQAKCLPQS
jgi:hypothetical protein